MVAMNPHLDPYCMAATEREQATEQASSRANVCHQIWRLLSFDYIALGLGKGKLSSKLANLLFNLCGLVLGPPPIQYGLFPRLGTSPS